MNLALLYLGRPCRFHVRITCQQHGLMRGAIRDDFGVFNSIYLAIPLKVRDYVVARSAQVWWQLGLAKVLVNKENVTATTLRTQRRLAQFGMVSGGNRVLSRRSFLQHFVEQLT